MTPIKIRAAQSKQPTKWMQLYRFGGRYPYRRFFSELEFQRVDRAYRLGLKRLNETLNGFGTPDARSTSSVVQP